MRVSEATNAWGTFTGVVYSFKLSAPDFSSTNQEDLLDIMEQMIQSVVRMAQSVHCFKTFSRESQIALLREGNLMTVLLLTTLQRAMVNHLDANMSTRVRTQCSIFVDYLLTIVFFLPVIMS